MQLIQANKNQDVSQCGFAHVGHLPRSPVFQFRFHSLVVAVSNLVSVTTHLCTERRKPG
jgi:hypothetical protein